MAVAVENRNDKGQFVNLGGKSTVLCVQCGQEFSLYPSDIRRGRRFCSDKCAGQWSSESRHGEKHHLYKADTVAICPTCGSQFSRKPGLMARPPIAYCSHACATKAQDYSSRTGENNSNWKGGISVLWQNFYLDEKWAEVRQAVYARDNWQCQNCGEKSRKLHAHHIIALVDNGAMYDLENIITLCDVCHYGYHHSGLILNIRGGLRCPLEALIPSKVV